MISSFYLSFSHFDLISGSRWVGVSNYIQLINHDETFRVSLWNTFWILLAAIPVRILFALITSIFLANLEKGRTFLGALVLLPSMLPGVAVTYVFVYILNPVYGPLNDLLRFIGFKNPPMWFFSPDSSKWGLVLIGIWGVGDSILLFSTRILSIPENLYILSRIDSVSQLKQILRITIPHLSPIIHFSIIFTVIQYLQIFSQSLLISYQVKDSQKSFYFLSNYVYDSAFKDFQLGYASAIGWIQTLISFCLVAVLFWISKFWVLPNERLGKL